MTLYEKTAYELSNMLLNKECSSVELTNAYLERIGAVDEKIQAFITVTGEKALEEAAQSDKRRASGKTLHPFDGIPLAVKDNICTKDVLTTCASKMLYNFVPPFNATVMDKLEAVGMVMLGKCNMDEFAMGSSCETSYFRQTVNPCDTSRVAGGSSGGSAAAVAAGEAPVALGSDTGGSVRLPAAYCGIIGLKPTYGSVSRFGGVAFGSSFDQISPMGRSVRDVAMLYGLLCGYDPMDATSARRDYPDFAAKLSNGVSGRTIGVPKEYFGKGVDAEVSGAVMAMLGELEKLGAKVVEVSLPSTDYALSAYYVISSAEASSNLARFDGTRYGYRAENYTDVNDMMERSRSKGFGEEVKRRIMLGTNVLSSGYYDAYYKRAKMVEQHIKEEFANVFDGCDFLAAPTAPSTAFKLGENLGDPVKMYASDICTVPASIAGIAAISIPCGSGENGMPIGMQFIGPKFSEEMLFTAAYACEQLSGGWNHIPRISQGGIANGLRDRSRA